MEQRGENRPAAQKEPCKPNFFILGAAKSGTTSLYSYLREHEDIFMSPVKEPTFFCDSFQVVPNPVDYLALFQGATSQRWIGEASHGYLTCPKSAALIRAFAPGARFVVILRNPVDRAFSLYNHMAHNGDEWIGSFEKALDVEERRAQDPWFQRHNPQYFYNYLYYRSGLYAEQIERYFKLFDRDRFLFLLYDELKTDGLAVLRRICSFLDIFPFAPELEVCNKGAAAHSAPWQFFVKHRIGPLLSGLRVPGAFAKTEWLMKRNRIDRPAPMNPDTRAYLSKLYRDDLRRVASLTGLDLSAWLGPAPAWTPVARPQSDITLPWAGSLAATRDQGQFIDNHVEMQRILESADDLCRQVDQLQLRLQWKRYRLADWLAVKLHLLNRFNPFKLLSIVRRSDSSARNDQWADTIAAAKPADALPRLPAIAPAVSRSGPPQSSSSPSSGVGLSSG